MTSPVEKFGEFADDQLLNEYFKNRAAYTAEAVQALKGEIDRRGISDETIGEFIQKSNDPEKELNKEDFDTLTTFLHKDLYLIVSILSDRKIPFLFKAEESDPTGTVIVLKVHKNFADQAREACGEHFEFTDDGMRLMEMSLAERLAAINFHELQLDEATMGETVSVALEQSEKKVILGMLHDVMDSIDEIEERLARPMFYFDNVEDVAAKMKADQPGYQFSIADLITIVEVLQVFCADGIEDDQVRMVTTLVDFIENLRND